MNNALFMPRYGSLESKRLRMFCWLAFALMFAMLIPDLAMAFDGNFKPDEAIVKNVDGSMASWWRTISVPAFWVALAGLVVSVLFMGGRGWYIPLTLAAIFLFGEMLIKGARTMMG